MQKKLQAKLYRKYPELFQDRKKPGSETRMCDGICCDDGWYELIDDVCLQLQFINQQYNALYTFFQIKEKLGGLRLYINQPAVYGYPLSKKIKVVISKMVHCIKHFAECQSYCTCEQCGGYRHGSKVIGTWIHALCDKCWEEFKKENKIVSKKKRINKR